MRTLFSMLVFGALALAFSPSTQATPSIPDSVSPAVAHGPEGHHWHALLVNEKMLVALDSHRASVGTKPGTKKAHLVVIHDSLFDWAGMEQDYMLMKVEFDCSTKGLLRNLATMGYRVVGGRSIAVNQGLTPTAWEVDESHVFNVTWTVVCGTLHPANALSPNLSFEQMLDKYRQSLTDAAFDKRIREMEER